MLSKTGKSKINMVDPNVKERSLNIEEMIMFVELTSKSRSRSILDTTSGAISSIVAKSTSYLSAKEYGKELFLSTDYTLNDGEVTKDSKSSYEGLGIKDIRISYGLDFVPQVKITLVDTKGQALFNYAVDKDDDSTKFSYTQVNQRYGDLFRLPYPVFNLRVKGYFGGTVNYLLNLTKVAINYVPETGNYELVCDFISFNFSFLSDLSIDQVRAVNNFEEAKDKLKLIYNKPEYKDPVVPGTTIDFDGTSNGEILTIEKLIDVSRSLPVYLNEIRNTNPDIIKANDLIQLNTELNDFEKLLVGGLFNGIPGNNGNPLPTIQSAGLRDALFIFNDVNNITFRELLVAIDKKIDDINLIIDIKAINVNKIDVNSKFNPINPSGLNNIGNIFDEYDTNTIDFNTFTNKIKTPTISDLDKIYSKLKIVMNESIDTTIPDAKTFTSFITNKNTGKSAKLLFDKDNKFAKIRAYIAETKLDIIKAKTTINLTATTSVKNEILKKIGFTPTIENIYRILCANVESFLEIINDVSRAASSSGIKASRVSSFSSLKSDIPNSSSVSSGPSEIFPFPLVYDEGYEELYIGRGYNGDTGIKVIRDESDFPEIAFIEKILEHLDLVVKRDKFNNVASSGTSGTATTNFNDSVTDYFDKSLDDSAIANIILPSAIVAEDRKGISVLSKIGNNEFFNIFYNLTKSGKQENNVIYEEYIKANAKLFFNDISFQVSIISLFLPSAKLHFDIAATAKNIVVDLDLINNKIINEVNLPIPFLSNSVDAPTSKPGYLDDNIKIINSNISNVAIPGTKPIKNYLFSIDQLETYIKLSYVNKALSIDNVKFSDFNQLVTVGGRRITIPESVNLLNLFGDDFDNTLTGSKTVKQLIQIFYYVSLVYRLDNFDNFLRGLDLNKSKNIVYPSVFVYNNLFKIIISALYFLKQNTDIKGNKITAIGTTDIFYGKTKITKTDFGSYFNKFVDLYGEIFFNNVSKDSVLINDIFNALTTTGRTTNDFLKEGSVELRYPIILSNPINKSINYETGDIKLDLTLINQYRLFLASFFSEVKRLVSDSLVNTSTNTNKTATSSSVVKDTNKISIYRYYSNFYSKWVGGIPGGKSYINTLFGAGGDFGSTKDSLIDYFMFTDRLWDYVGDKALINFEHLSNVLENRQINFYDLIANIAKKNNFLMFNIPNRVVFNNTSTSGGINPVEELFKLNSRADGGEGPFIWMCYMPGGSETIKVSDKYSYDDKPLSSIGINKSETLEPLIIRSTFGAKPASYDPITKNKYEQITTGFIVTPNHSNQSIFYKVNFDQQNIIETDESLKALSYYVDNREPGKAFWQGADLYSIFNKRSYSSTVSCFGNMFITPMQYFEVTNTPLFDGMYLINKVEHNIVANKIDTVFTGVKQSTFVRPIKSDYISYLNYNDEYDNKKTVNNITSSGESNVRVYEFRLKDTIGKPNKGELSFLKPRNSKGIPTGSGPIGSARLVVKLGTFINNAKLDNFDAIDAFEKMTFVFNNGIFNVFDNIDLISTINSEAIAHDIYGDSQGNATLGIGFNIQGNSDFKPKVLAIINRNSKYMGVSPNLSSFEKNKTTNIILDERQVFEISAIIIKEKMTEFYEILKKNKLVESTSGGIIKIKKLNRVQVSALFSYAYNVGKKSVDRSFKKLALDLSVSNNNNFDSYANDIIKRTVGETRGRRDGELKYLRSGIGVSLN